MGNNDWHSLPKKEKRRLKKEFEKLEQAQEKRKGKLIKWGFLLGIIVVLVGGFFLVNLIGKKQFGKAPRLEVTPETFDFGKVSVSKGKAETTFSVKNSGFSPLVISGAKTSCDCTTAQLKIGENVSPLFGMHTPPADWSVTLAPEQTAKLQVFYDPQVHPEQGPITRVISLFSNDPRQKEKPVTIFANVQP